MCCTSYSGTVARGVHVERSDGYRRNGLKKSDPDRSERSNLEPTDREEAAWIAMSMEETGFFLGDQQMHEDGGCIVVTGRLWVVGLVIV